MSKGIAMQKKNRLRDVLKKLDTKQMDESTYLIIGKNNGTFPYSNSLLIVDEEVVLIDSGIGDEQINVLKDEIDILINSHYHIDHILGNYIFSELWVVEQEAEVTSSFDNYKRFAGISGTKIEDNWLGWFHQYFKFHASSPTKTFKPNEVFKFGETEWRAVHTPGHSPGHCCFYEPNKRIMFSSDLDLTSFGPWYGNPNANLPDFIESIKKLSNSKMDVIATSHTLPLLEGIPEALEDYLNIIYKREEQILELLKKEKSVSELEANNIIYKEEQKGYEAFAWFEQKMLKKHLDRLIESEKVEKIGDKYKVL
ncbi:MAG: MBL fold metallo-hydrolase [Thermoplasmata archaeon]|nr:MAG: MBL fold metallo-hydrolase [Thermoplasmata archaeon]